MSYQAHHPHSIQTMFNSIAERYDLTNTVLSLRMHKKWNQELVKSIIQPQPQTLVDLCSGTGDIAFDYLKTTSFPSKIYLVDFSDNMLDCAREKSHKLLLPPSHRLQFVQSDVQNMPLPNELADCATMAYGIRNVRNPKQAIQEAYRILKPGGQFSILELTRPNNFILRTGHLVYLKLFLPILGKLLTTNKDAYKYLQNSIRSFIPPEELENILIETGFHNTKRISLSGGIATIITGQKK